MFWRRFFFWFVLVFVCVCWCLLFVVLTGREDREKFGAKVTEQYFFLIFLTQVILIDLHWGLETRCEGHGTKFSFEYAGFYWLFHVVSPLSHPPLSLPLLSRACVLAFFLALTLESLP